MGDKGVSKMYQRNTENKRGECVVTAFGRQIYRGEWSHHIQRKVVEYAMHNCCVVTVCGNDGTLWSRVSGRDKDYE